MITCYLRYFIAPGKLKELGPANVGIALYSFRDLDAYNDYRRMAAVDEECKAVTAHFNETKCFVAYERNFVRRIE
jgi:hypothetical protein